MERMIKAKEGLAEGVKQGNRGQEVAAGEREASEHSFPNSPSWWMDRRASHGTPVSTWLIGFHWTELKLWQAADRRDSGLRKRLSHFFFRWSLPLIKEFSVIEEKKGREQKRRVLWRACATTTVMSMLIFTQRIDTTTSKMVRLKACVLLCILKKLSEAWH